MIPSHFFKDLGDQREDLGDQREDLFDQREDLDDQRKDLGDKREDFGDQRKDCVYQRQKKDLMPLIMKQRGWAKPKQLPAGPREKRPIGRLFSSNNNNAMIDTIQIMNFQTIKSFIFVLVLVNILVIVHKEWLIRDIYNITELENDGEQVS